MNKSDVTQFRVHMQVGHQYLVALQHPGTVEQ